MTKPAYTPTPQQHKKTINARHSGKASLAISVCRQHLPFKEESWVFSIVGNLLYAYLIGKIELVDCGCSITTILMTVDYSTPSELTDKLIQAIHNEVS